MACIEWVHVHVQSISGNGWYTYKCDFKSVVQLIRVVNFSGPLDMIIGSFQPSFNGKSIRLLPVTEHNFLALDCILYKT